MGHFSRIQMQMQIQLHLRDLSSPGDGWIPMRKGFTMAECRGVRVAFVIANCSYHIIRISEVLCDAIPLSFVPRHQRIRCGISPGKQDRFVQPSLMRTWPSSGSPMFCELVYSIPHYTEPDPWTYNQAEPTDYSTFDLLL